MILLVLKSILLNQIIERGRLGLITKIAEQIYFVSNLVIKPLHFDEGA